MYKNPKPTVDLLIYRTLQNTTMEIVLIKRKNPPVGWALPGGFVDEGESVEHAAKREALEETGMNVTLKELLYVYSKPTRDIRQHNISVVFTAESIDDRTPKGMDDASDAQWFSLEHLPAPLVFDHEQIINDFITLNNTGLRPNPEEGR